MLVLFETPAGYAIFKLLDERRLERTENLYRAFSTPARANRVVRLQHFERFLDTAEALAATTATVEGKISKKLKKVIKRHIDRDLQEKLLVADARLGAAIRSKYSVQCVANTSVQELMRCIRSQLDSLLSELPQRDMTAMTLGLAHSLSRYKLKFSPDKIDTMIVQAISLLGDLDKEINNYVMRLREWYGWHFPELGKIVADHVTYAKIIKIVGTRENTSTSDLSDILPENIEAEVKEAAEISMGSEISDFDIMMIQRLCDEIIENINYRANLYDYICGRMMAIAPNVTVLVGELVGARLMAHAGSLVSLAKHAASTIQILGAEKALFRALKTRHNTPKYGLIYHAELVGQCREENKGKMSRMLAAKVALATRVDALGEDGIHTLGIDHKQKLEERLRVLQDGNVRRVSGTGRARARFEKYHGTSEVRPYPAAADSTLPSTSGTQPPSGKRKRSDIKKPKEEDDDKERVETSKQKKKRIKRELQEAELSRAGPSGVTIEEATAGPSGVRSRPSGAQTEEVRAGPSGVQARPSKVKARSSGIRVEEQRAGPSGVRARPSGIRVEEERAGPSGVQARPSKVKARSSGIVEEERAGPSGVQARPSGIRVEEERAGPSGVQARPSKVKARSSGIVEEERAGPSGVQTRPSKVKARSSGIVEEERAGPSGVQARPSKVKARSSGIVEEVRAGPSGVQARPSGIRVEEVTAGPSGLQARPSKVKSKSSGGIRVEEATAGSSRIKPRPSGIKVESSLVKIEKRKLKAKEIERKIKKEERKQKLMRSAVSETTEHDGEQTSPKKKKKKIKLEPEQSDSRVEEIQQPVILKKKKKKVRPDVETSVEAIEGMPGPSSSQSAPPLPKKKKKKKVKPELQIEVVESEVTPQQSAPTSPKKKKKKVRQELGESETNVVAVEVSEPSTSSKKKKKKKRHDNDDE